MNLFGRREILSSVDEITRENVLQVLIKASGTHSMNAREIDYLWRYMRGEQPVLCRQKKIRPEICNKIVENHAVEIVNFTAGFLLGEPVTYVRRGDRQNTSDEIRLLNDYMYYSDKSSHDKDMATWMSTCGVAYRMVLPKRDVLPDDSPFEIDTPDPRTTFVVYHSGFGHRRLMGVRIITKERADGSVDIIYCGYTQKYYFEVTNGSLTKWESHMLGDIPIFEYRLNMARMGSFEPAVPLLNAINEILSNRVDSIEQFVQSFLKFKNCEIDEEGLAKLKELGAIQIKSAQGVDSDVDIISQELSQSQVQTLVDYLYDQVLVICGMPTSTKGGASTSDTGKAVYLRDGWSQSNSRARDSELLFKRSEKDFLRMVLRIIRGVREFGLQVAEVECKFTRTQYDNLLTKTQSLLHLLEAGLAPEIAISATGLFNDPMDIAEQSKDYLRKWEYVPMVDEPRDDTDFNRDTERFLDEAIDTNE